MDLSSGFQASGGTPQTPDQAQPGQVQPSQANRVMDANVFQIGTGWSPELKGGAETMFFNLYHGLRKAGFSVRGVVPGSGDVKRTTGGMIDGFARGDSLPRRGMAIRRSVLDSFREARPDVIASHFALYTLPVLDRIGHTPMVVHFFGPWALESLIEGAGALSVRAKKAIERLVYSRAQRVIVMSNAFGALLQEHYGVPENLIRLVPGGVDCQRFHPVMSREDAREAMGWERDRPAVLTVRRLVKRMGLDRLVDAMAILRKASTPGARDVVLHIAGSGPERAALEAQVAALGLADAVRFDGFVAEERLATAYRAATITLVPTMELEGFGLVAVESLAAGTPVLATPVGGLPEVVSGLSSSMVLRGFDAQSIADGVAEGLANASFLPDSEACRCYAQEYFDWSRVIPKIAAVYREVL